jgi:hypothetical protein
MTDDPKPSPSMNDAAAEQRDAANAVARRMAGATVEPGGTPAPAEVAPIKAPPTYVRLPCEGYSFTKWAKDVGAILKTNGVFRIGRMPVTISTEPTSLGSIEPMDADRFRTYVEKHMVPAKRIPPAEEGGLPKWIEKTMQKDVASATLRSDAFVDQQRLVTRVNMERMPIIRKDGKLVLLQPGYDVEAKIYTMPTAIEIDETMKLDQARAIYNDLVGEFPYGDYKEDNEENRKAGTVGLSRSKAVHFSCAVSLYGSGLLSDLSNRLHYVFGANAQRSGKTLLAKTAVVPIFGPAKVKTLPKDDNELRKMLDSAAIGNAPYFFLDDLEGSLRSTELNAFMTAPTWSNRMFNKQVDFAAAKQTVVIITGNNLGLSTDLANRTLLCHLYTDEFDAQKRDIKRVIDEEYLARPHVRKDVLSALWCFIREWDKAGRPRGKRVLKGFEAWCDVFGGITINAGYGDPVAAPPTDEFTGDNEGTDMMTVVDVLVSHMDHPDPLPGSEPGSVPEPVKKREFTFDDLVGVAIENDCFQWMIDGVERIDKETDEKSMKLNPRSKSALGKMFSAKYGGRKFRLADGRVVKFGHRGRNRHRRYQIEIL